MTRVTFAVSNSTYLQVLLDLKVKHILVSYYYVKKEKKFFDLIKTIDLSKTTVMLDSGAHSLHEGIKVDYDLFFKEYLLFLIENKKYFTNFVELDIEAQVGYEKVKEWTKQMVETVGKPIVVWHKERGIKEWEEMCKNYPYVGFSGFVTVGGEKEIPIKYVNSFLKIAKKYGTKVHGFGFTDKNLKKHDFYSVDSSSWTAGTRFGTMFHFKNNTLKSTRFKKKMSNQAITYWNTNQWNNYANYLEELENDKHNLSKL